MKDNLILKRKILDLKHKVDTSAHEFIYESGYLTKYLKDFSELTIRSNYLAPDAKIYSSEADDYFWNINHEDYFSKSFIFMLMQISEDLVNRYIDDWEILYPGFASYKKKTNLGFYELRGEYLKNNNGFDISWKTWQNLLNLYQLRNCLTHDNGYMQRITNSKRTEAIDKLTSYRGITISQNRIVIDVEFCKEMLQKIFIPAFKHLYSNTNKHLNQLKRGIF